MSSDAPDSTTQRYLFELRSSARTKEIQRRSRMRQTAEITEDHNAKMKVFENADLHRHSVERLQNAEVTIVELLKHTIAYRSAIEKMAAGNPDTELKNLEVINRLLDNAMREIDASFNARPALIRWAKSAMATGDAIAQPAVSKKS